MAFTEATRVTSRPEPVAAPGASARLSGRLEFVDALRVCLIVLVVAHHALEAYATRHPGEVPLPEDPIPRIWAFLWVNAAFFMGLFFFLAGYFTAGAADRKGIAGFLGERFLRIGVPLLLATVLIAPLPVWSHLAMDPAMPRIGYWTYLWRDFFGLGPKPAVWPVRERWPAFNFAHLWFLEHLLVYAVLYAGLRALLPARRITATGNPPSHMAIAAYAVLLSAATFVIRIWYPQDRWIGFLGFIQMEPAHMAQYASLFVIGVYAGPRRWLETMPTRRGMIWLAIGGGLAVAAYLLIGAGVIVRNTSRAWWVCAAESFLCTGLCVGLPVLFRDMAVGTGRIWRVLSRNVFAVYVWHFPIVMLLQWLLIGAPAPAWLRLLVTVAGAIVASFAFTNWVILRLPYARRVF